MNLNAAECGFSRIYRPLLPNLHLHTYSAMRNCGGPDIWRERTYRGGLVGRGSLIVLVVMILIYYTN